MPVKPLSFKGDKKPSKKRKHRAEHNADSTPGDPTTTAADEDDDSWTTPDALSDLTGPTLIILPTRPATCLASDANGNVYASQLENLIEGHAETAEPQDVRQVWVANQIPGTGGQMSFKGAHGGYLSCDGTGILGARREARGVEEGFVLVQAQAMEGESRRRWRLQTAANSSAKEDGISAESRDGDSGKRYLAAHTEGQGQQAGTQDDDEEEEKPKMTTKKITISLRGDGEASSPATELIIKMQARFKPKVQQDKDTKAREKVSRQELEHAVGRKLDDDEVRRLKRARKNGTYHEEILDVRVKGKHDKFA